MKKLWSNRIVPGNNLILHYLFIILPVLVILFTGCNSGEQVLHVCGSDTNDLLQLLNSRRDLDIRSYQSPQEAVQAAREGEAVLVVADGYPDVGLDLTPEFFAVADSRKLRVYVEYPSYLPGIDLAEPMEAHVERVVVNSSCFGAKADSLSILVVNGMHFLPATVPGSLLVAARVAGFDQALFGLPEKRYPLLFEVPGYSILASTTCLSRMVTARYSPMQEWSEVWRTILGYLLPETDQEPVTWEPRVKPMYGANEKLPAGYQKEAVKTGIEWFNGSKMVVDNGKEGSYEAIMSVIDENGNQPLGMVKRGDCIGETAMAHACSGALFGNSHHKEIAANLLNYYLTRSTAAQNEWADSTHGAYGLIPWGITNYAWYRANYGDDNAREMMGIMVTAALNGSQEWDTILMRCLLAQLRTTGKSGFRGDRIDLPEFTKYGWEYYFNRDLINIAPHFESYLWACFLWAYDKTHYAPFLEKAEKAIRITMANYPAGWRWTNGMAQEKARMILPLAWLVRVKDIPEYRGYLNLMLDELLQLQDSSGAIREEIGDLAKGMFPPPQSNEAYGTNEASLIGVNGDRVADLLYTTNFAFLGLHEAAAATGDPKIRAAEDKLAEFLCRIQVRAPAYPELHGGWFRAFDYGRYEHWGCNADHGWGAWCIESGWTQGWITTVLSLREMDTSVWDLTTHSQVGKAFPELRRKLLPKLP